jgi:hypothetical protein
MTVQLPTRNGKVIEGLREDFASWSARPIAEGGSAPVRQFSSEFIAGCSLVTRRSRSDPSSSLLE